MFCIVVTYLSMLHPFSLNPKAYKQVFFFLLIYTSLDYIDNFQHSIKTLWQLVLSSPVPAHFYYCITEPKS